MLFRNPNQPSPRAQSRQWFPGELPQWPPYDATTQRYIKFGMLLSTYAFTYYIAFTRGDRRRNRSAQPVAATIAPCKHGIRFAHYTYSEIDLWNGRCVWLSSVCLSRVRSRKLFVRKLFPGGHSCRVATRATLQNPHWVIAAFAKFPLSVLDLCW